MTDVKEAVELEKLVLAVVKDVVKSMEDGKLSTGDVLNFADVILLIQPALSGISEVPAELADLDSAEAEELISTAVEAIPGLQGKPVAVVKAAMKVVLASAELYHAVKS